MKKMIFFSCSLCAKRLIGRRSNGTFVFLFGGGETISPLVHIEVFGQIRMKCLRRTCRKAHPDHWNVFTFFPESFTIAKDEPIDDSKPSFANPAIDENPILIETERSSV